MIWLLNRLYKSGIFLRRLFHSKNIEGSDWLILIHNFQNAFFFIKPSQTYLTPNSSGLDNMMSITCPDNAAVVTLLSELHVNFKFPWF